MKELIIPITKDRFGFSLLYGVTVLSWIVFIYYCFTGIDQQNHEVGIALTAFIGVLAGTTFSIAFTSERHDLNPFHVIGYCIRFKEKKKNENRDL